MPTSTLTTRGQTTIPKSIRDALDLQPGDRLAFTLQGNEVVLRRAQADLSALDGMLDHSGTEPVLRENMNEAIGEAAKRHLEAHCTQDHPGSVSVIVLCELAWVLNRAYDADPAKIARIIDQLLRTRQLRVQRREQGRAALAEYVDSGADFSDCLIGQLHQTDGADETIPFDQKAARLRDWRELEWQSGTTNSE